MSTFKFTLCAWEVDRRRLVYGTNSYSRMSVGTIYRFRKKPKGYIYSATKHWEDGSYRSFTTFKEARKWVEDSFREQVLGEVIA